MKPSKIDIRPWGQFEQFTHNEQTTIKIISVKAGQRLSKQRHQKRDELWIALDDGLIAEINEKAIDFKKGDKIFIPKTTIHRISTKDDLLNKHGIKEARFLEIAYGEFDELDIERLSDDYGRK